MKVPASRSFAAHIYVIAIVLALGLTVPAKAQLLAEDSPAEMIRRLEELYQQGKFKEATPLAKKLVVLTRAAKGDQDPETATALNNLAVLYNAMGDYFHRDHA